MLIGYFAMFWGMHDIKLVIEYDQEIAQSHTADQPMTP